VRNPRLKTLLTLRNISGESSFGCDRMKIHSATFDLFVKKLSGKGLLPFLVLFVTSVVVSGFLIAKIAENISYRGNIDRAVEISKETWEVQYYLTSHSNAQPHVRQDSHYWFVHWNDPTSWTLEIVDVVIDKDNWKVVSVEIVD